MVLLFKGSASFRYLDPYVVVHHPLASAKAEKTYLTKKLYAYYTTAILCTNLYSNTQSSVYSPFY